MAISTHVRQRVARQAHYRCGYCQTQEVVSGIPLTLEHLQPKARGGSDDEENLWMSCRLCNESKGVVIEATDPATGEVVPLYNPRMQRWEEHFVWDEAGIQLQGLTPVGRATIQALDLNGELRVRSRSLWVEAGFHPPD